MESLKEDVQELLNRAEQDVQQVCSVEASDVDTEVSEAANELSDEATEVADKHMGSTTSDILIGLEDFATQMNDISQGVQSAHRGEKVTNLEDTYYSGVDTLERILVELEEE